MFDVALKIEWSTHYYPVGGSISQQTGAVTDSVCFSSAVVQDNGNNLFNSSVLKSMFNINCRCTQPNVWNLNNTLKKLNNTLWHWRQKQRRKKEALLVLPSVPLVLDGRTVSTFTGASTLGRLPHVTNGCINCGCREVNDYLEHKLHVFNFVSSFSLSLRVFFFFSDRLVNNSIFQALNIAIAAAYVQISSMMADEKILISNWSF